MTPMPSRCWLTCDSGGIIDELREAIRRELGADRVPLGGGPYTGPTLGEMRIPRPGDLPTFGSEDEDPTTAPSH